MEVLRAKLNQHTISTWLEPLACERVTNDSITFSVPNNFFVLWIKENYIKVIGESLKELTGNNYEMYFTCRDNSHPSGAGTDPTPCASSPVSVSLTEEFALKRNLNPRYTFESFVVGSCNQFAHAAALSVSEKLGGSYNPLFFMVAWDSARPIS